jgi:hypothetical protein
VISSTFVLLTTRAGVHGGHHWKLAEKVSKPCARLMVTTLSASGLFDLFQSGFINQGNGDRDISGLLSNT